MVYRPNIQSDHCFIITPYNVGDVPSYSRVLEPAAKACKLQAQRADHTQTPENILTGLWRNLWQTQVVVAVVTGNNPNVNYELGIAHTLGIPTLLIAKDPCNPQKKREEVIPVDYRHHRVIWYNLNNADWEKELTDQIIQGINEVKAKADNSPFLSWPYDNGASIGCERVYRNLDSISVSDWHGICESANRISISKLRLHVKEDIYWTEIFEKVLERGGQVKLAMSDPVSPAMLLRYWDERALSDPKDLTAWKDGLDQLAQILEDLVAWKKQCLSKNLAKEEQIEIRLNPNYPTHAIYRIECSGKNYLLFFIYPFSLRGFQSPVYRFTDPRTFGFRFYESCLERTVRCCELITEDKMAYISKLRKSGKLRDEAVLDARVEWRINWLLRIRQNRPVFT